MIKVIFVTVILGLGLPFSSLATSSTTTLSDLNVGLAASSYLFLLSAWIMFTIMTKRR